MFGHDRSQQMSTSAMMPSESAQDQTNPMAQQTVMPEGGLQLPQPQPMPAPTTTPEDTAIQDSINAMMSQGAPILTNQVSPSNFIMDDPSPPQSVPVATPDSPIISVSMPAAVPAVASVPVSDASDELFAIKQEALQQLSPLVSHLE